MTTVEIRGPEAHKGDFSSFSPHGQSCVYLPSQMIRTGIVVEFSVPLPPLLETLTLDAGRLCYIIVTSTHVALPAHGPLKGRVRWLLELAWFTDHFLSGSLGPQPV